ncbi:hypothetical protein GCT13_27815 [Paraburkholderia sp. CNPSo 3157]|uniref:Uncharacterized protein n=1 Tax=Paraburkholderia franconis TaxID=2654983 RepID=A0A7X1NEV1_9BURK|nr:hypothetical protein [Paraburkholderia franconis]MPW20584.1 hypothetical protein [Paraburkholderia franconis]
MHNAASPPCGQKKTGHRIRRAGVIAFVRLYFTTNGFLQSGAARPWSFMGHAMKRRSSAIPVRQAPKSRAALADGELQHLETVVRHLCNTDVLDAKLSLGVSYWLSRIAEIEQRFYLVTPQLRRLALLRKMLADVS